MTDENVQFQDDPNLTTQWDAVLSKQTDLTMHVVGVWLKGVSSKSGTSEVVREVIEKAVAGLTDMYSKEDFQVRAAQVMLDSFDEFKE